QPGSLSSSVEGCDVSECSHESRFERGGNRILPDHVPGRAKRQIETLRRDLHHHQSRRPFLNGFLSSPFSLAGLGTHQYPASTGSSCTGGGFSCFACLLDRCFFSPEIYFAVTSNHTLDATRPRLDYSARTEHAPICSGKGTEN